MKWRPGLQTQMTLSYIGVTVVATLLLTGINIAFMATVTQSVLPQERPILVPLVEQHAQLLALEAAIQSQDTELAPATTFVPHQPTTLLLPQGMPALNTATSGQHRTFAVLLTPDGHILASTFPLQYPPATLLSQILPQEASAIRSGLAGIPSSHADLSPLTGTITAIAPVWNRTAVLLGMIYVQEGAAPLHAAFIPLINPWAVLGPAFMFGLILFCAPMIGGGFGFLTTRRLVRRIRSLALASARVGAGCYGEPVRVGRQDELSQLEAQFNAMATQLDSTTQARQALAAQNAQLAERGRIARELHDALSQNLFSLRMLADGMQHAMSPSALESGFHTQVQTIADTTTTMMQEMRAMLMALRPPELAGQSLATAVAHLAHTYQLRLGISVTTEIAVGPMTEAIEHALWRIAQEALNNAVRHARATVIHLLLTSNDQEITLQVIDNGQGFDAGAERVSQGLGLQGMWERVDEVHGTIALISQPGQGTQIRVTIPGGHPL